MATNYTDQLVNPSNVMMQNQAFGLEMQAKQQAMEQAAAQEARTAEMQPLALQGAQLGLDGQRVSNAAAEFNLNQGRNEASRRDQFQSAMGRLASLGPDATVADYAEVTTQFPEYGQSVLTTYDALDDARKESVASVLAQGVYAFKNGNTETGMTLLKQYRDAAERTGDAALMATAESLMKVAETNPNAALAAAGMALQTIAPEMNDRIFGGGDVRVQSSQNVGPTLSVQTMTDGTTRVINTATNEVLTGQAASDAIADAQASELQNQRDINIARQGGRNEANIDTAGTVEATKALGRAQATFVEDALRSSSQVASGMNTINEAISALDAGARAGAIDKFLPNVSEASASLSNAMDRMGLDVIGSVTFGALSEGELRLAMETAVPRNLDEPELRAWLERKLDAQRKVRAALIEQAQFLSDPQNTLNDWANMIGGGSPQPAAPQSAPQDQQPEQPSFMRFGGGN